MPEVARRRRPAQGRGRRHLRHRREDVRASRPFPDPVIMGHENVGVIARAGRDFVKRHGLGEGDRVFVEHYVGCFHCEWCHRGEYRHCENTDWRTNPDARRYGYTSRRATRCHLWGGFAQYLYLPWNAVLHKVPDGVSAELAGIVTPLSNGIEWALVDRRRRLRLDRAHPGAGPAGAVPGGRLQAGRRLARSSSPAPPGTRPGWSWPTTSAPTTRSTCSAEDPLERIREITGGAGVDVVLDCTAGAGTAPVLLGIDALKRREGTMVIQGELAAFPDFPVKKVTEKAITHQERPRAQLPGLRARARAAGLAPLPARAAGHPQLRPGRSGPGDPGGRRRGGRGRRARLAAALAGGLSR